MSSGSIKLDIEITHADDYDDESRSKWQLTATHPQDLTAQAAVMKFQQGTIDLFSSTGEISSISGDDYLIEFPLTSAQTGQLVGTEEYTYVVVFDVNGSEWKPIYGKVSVLRID